MGIQPSPSPEVEVRSRLTGRPNTVILYGVTSSLTLHFFRDQFQYLDQRGYVVHAISAPPLDGHGVRVKSAIWHAVEMRREISPLRDLVSLFRIWRLLRELRPSVVNFGTPKAGLLGGLAAAMAFVPCRIYTLHGLRLETAAGWKKFLLRATERIACKCANRVFAVSGSLRELAIHRGIVDPDRVVVLGRGTVDGICVDKFSPSAEKNAEASCLRRELGIPVSAPVIGFVGRFTRDKGIMELYESFLALRRQRPELRLLLVGEFEDGDPVSRELRQAIENDASVVRTGFVADSAPYYHLMNVVVLPTYREGFPIVPLEAQAAAVPVVTTSATGAVESVVHGQTGLVVPVASAKAIEEATGRLLDDPSLRKTMGIAGQEWVQREFCPDRIRQELCAEYEKLLLRNQSTRESLSRKFQGFLKRSMDIAGSGLALLLFSPVIAVIAMLVRFKLGSPVLFRQRRPGRFGKPFSLLKFRSMTNSTDTNGNLLPDSSRLSRFGRLLRSSSLDELPELWNVIRGEMSLVGPRPLLMAYLDRYTAEQARRHEVRPGVTGWAQVNGRNRLTWEEKFSLDVWYVDNWSLSLDFKIIFTTIWRVFKREGISQPGQATSEEFLGTSRSI